MISTKSLIAKVQDVPNTWVFEYYCKLQEKLTGQTVQISSFGITKEQKTPSFNIFWNVKSGKYKFEDYAQGIWGDEVELVMYLFKLIRPEAQLKIVEDYNQFVLDHGGEYTIGEFKEHAKYKVTKFVKRKWNILDKNYWMDYKIGSKNLEEDFVFPLQEYTMEKEEDREVKTLTINGYYIYGYFRKDGSLYKIYQPKTKDKKFIKVKNYIQGTDQLEFKKPYLVITSSLKDRRCLLNMGYNLESIAPDSENTLIPDNVITVYKDKYKGIATLFDNDEAGIRAMAKYKEKYNIPGVLLKLEKDLSDSVKLHGPDKVSEILKPLLTAKLKPKTEKV